MNEIPTSDEKVLAALAHASVIFSFFGPVGPILIWIFQRNKSKYIRYHALQAMGYQALAFWVWFAGIFVIMFGGTLLAVVLEVMLTENTAGGMPIYPFIIQPIIFLGTFGMWGIFFIIGIIGAVFCMSNRNFNYPLIGRWLQSKVFSEQNNESDSEVWEENWVSGICHSTAILQLWGIVTPLIVWFSQKERSVKLRFQALQAIFYQLIAFVVYMLGVVAYMVFIFVMVFGLAALGIADPAASNRGDLPPAFGMIGLVFFGVIIIFWLFMMIAVPFYYLLAAIASVLTIRGKDFKYPILGGIIARRITPKKKEAVSSI